MSNSNSTNQSGAVAITMGSITRPQISATSSGFILALLANILWGTSFLGSKYTLAIWGPITASALRFVVAVVGLWIGLRMTGRKITFPRDRKTWVSLTGVGLFGFGILYPLQLFGLKLIPTGLSASIMLSSPIVVIAVSAIVLREIPTWNKWLALAIGVVGGLILLSPSSSALGSYPDTFWGSLITMLAAISLALSVIFTKRLGSTLDNASVTFWSMLIGLLMIVPFSFLEPSLQPPSQEALLLGLVALMYLGVVCSVVCFLIWNKAITSTSPNEIASTMHVKTPVAVLLGIAVVGEDLSWRILIGAMLVAIGVWISQLQSSRKKGQLK